MRTVMRGVATDQAAPSSRRSMATPSHSWSGTNAYENGVSSASAPWPDARKSPSGANRTRARSSAKSETASRGPPQSTTTVEPTTSAPVASPKSVKRSSGTAAKGRGGVRGPA